MATNLSEEVKMSGVSGSSKHEVAEDIGHREYLMARHKTLELEPVPSWSDNDPLNWSASKKLANLVLVAFHSAMATFTASSIIPAYESMAVDLNVSIQRVSYLTSLQICILGFAPLLWRPISERFGRRPVFLLSLLISLVGNVGCANCFSYATMALCRAIVAFFISPAAAIGSAVVKESYFEHERARYMGIWTIFITLGVPLSPLIFGFVTLRLDYRWIFWILAMINGLQLVLYALFGPESRFCKQSSRYQPSSWRQQYLSLRRIDPTPLTWLDFVRPLRFFGHINVLLPAVSYAMVFLFGSVMLTVEIPQLFAEKFKLSSGQLGLQFIGLIVGSLLGEYLGGFVSDAWMNRRRRRQPQTATAPEHRLWLSHAGYVLAIVGIVVFLIQLDRASAGHWNVTPIIGAGIAAAGNQLVTTVLITYSVDCHPTDAAAVGVFITLVRQTWGFLGPFWFPQMFASLGLRLTGIVAASLLLGASVGPTAMLQARRRLGSRTS